MALAMEVFQVSKQFPPEERFSMVDQIRRWSRSVCANVGEAWQKRRYRQAFVAKLNDAAAEASETLVWLEFAFKCDYLDQARFDSLSDACDHVIAQLVIMMEAPEKWLIPSK